MGWDRVGSMKKLDDWGSNAMNRVREQGSAGSKVGVGERWRMAKGTETTTDRKWSQYSGKTGTQAGQESEPTSPSLASSSSTPPPLPSARRPTPQQGRNVPTPPARAFASVSSSSKPYEFSTMSVHEKEHFFALLDEFFGVTEQQATAPAPAARAAPPAAPSLSPAGVAPSHSPAPAATPAEDGPCSALSAATFFVYPTSFPEWSSQWYAATPTTTPPHLANRKDLRWSCRTLWAGDKHTLHGALLFADLSALWYSVTWSASRPSDYSVTAAVMESPSALGAEELQSAAASIGEAVAVFAERGDCARQPVGDGECWTLAAHAIREAQASLGEPLVESVGRTHGHLIYHATPGTGTWRGFDRVRNDWGGVRRGDVVEWRRATCSAPGAQRGSYSTLGDPDHTAVVVDNAPLPDHVGALSEEEVDLAPAELGVITVIEQSAGKPPTRASYDLATFSAGELWIYRPVSLSVYLGGEVMPEWPPTLPRAEEVC